MPHPVAHHPSPADRAVILDDVWFAGAREDVPLVCWTCDELMLGGWRARWRAVSRRRRRGRSRGGVPLHRAVGARCAAAGRQLAQRRLGGAARDHVVGDAIGMTLVLVAGCADPAAQLYALALLDHVRRLMRRGVEIGRFAKGNRRASRVRRRADLLAGFGGRSANVRFYAGDVVAPEQCLDAIAVWQRLWCPRDAVLRRCHHVSTTLAVGFPL